jgi:hypothetical protein
MEQEHKIILCKPYLSWSQLNVWLTNPGRYRREYFENLDKLDTKYLRFGKGIAKMIEEGRHKELLPDLPTYQVPEFEIKTKVKDIQVLSYLDSYDPENNVFLEFKTGTQPWDQARVQKHDQLLFYATALKWANGKMPAYCDLVWIETRVGGMPSDDFWHENDGLVNCTGKIKSFHREFDEREVERMEELIVKCATEISEAYLKFIQEI